MGYHCQMLIHLTRRESAARCAGRRSIPNARGSVVSDRRGRAPQSSEAGREGRQRGEPVGEQIAPEPFEDRHNGAASLGIP